jgi:hypothetical protein
MWHFSQNETNYGPFSDEQMAQYIKQGNVTAQTMVWCEGMTDWMHADRTQLASHFARTLPTAGPVVTMVEDPVAKERKRKMNYWSLIGMGWMFGVIILCMGLQKSGERKESSGTPTRMSLAELAKNGPGKNTYIELTHLHFGEQLWIEQDRNTGIWTDVWTFVFPESDPKTPIAVVNIDGGGEAAMKKWMSDSKVIGIIESRPRFATSSYGKGLYAMYPNAKPDNVKWYIKAVYDRPSETGVKLTYASGIATILAGHLLAFLFYRKR